MSPRQRRNKIINRQIEGEFTNFQIIQESGYQGYVHYKQGVDAGDSKVYDVEQALDRLESAKEA